MSRRNRREVIDESVVGAYHVWSRSVRRAFLTGYDRRRKRDYSYRRSWLRRRVELLAGIFAIDVLDYTVLSNHFHAILRNRPDVVARWSDEEVARRFLRLQRSVMELNAEPSADKVAAFVADAPRLARARRLLSSISEFMGHLKEPIARLANAEDECTGNFWQSRFGARRLPNEVSLLVCSLYVNLNPLEAGLVERPEQAEFTSVRDRVLDRQEKSAGLARSGDLAAVHVDGDGYDGAGERRRASNKGYLNIRFSEYLELLDELARRSRAERAGREFDRAPPILRRLGLDEVEWEREVRTTSRRFARERQIMADMAAEAQRKKRS